MPIDSIESLRKLNIAYFLASLRIHHETHRFPESLAVIYVVITINIE